MIYEFHSSGPVALRTDHIHLSTVMVFSRVRAVFQYTVPTVTHRTRRARLLYLTSPIQLCITCNDRSGRHNLDCCSILRGTVSPSDHRVVHPHGVPTGHNPDHTAFTVLRTLPGSFEGKRLGRPSTSFRLPSARELRKSGNGAQHLYDVMHI